jgi:hypothetical protein
LSLSRTGSRRSPRSPLRRKPWSDRPLADQVDLRQLTFEAGATADGLRTNGPELVADVLDGVTFEDGVKVEKVNNEEVAA